MNNLINLSKEVKEALDKNRPVIALESTIIAHGFPYPDNIKLAKELIKQTKEKGVMPATVAIIDGKIRVGLNDKELEYIAKSDNIHKASLRDIPVLNAKKLSGATTVAATMQIAYLAGIDLFVTGGIGGVHRGAESSFDISADLNALAKFPVTVICAGAKSVLDLAKTQEVLETKGVPLLGYKTNKLPAFYLRESEFDVDYRIENVKEIVEIIKANKIINNSNGILVTVPIPKEDELDKVKYNNILDKLLIELKEKSITGKKITPYLLSRINKETKGESVQANVSLVKNNLKVGIDIAQKLKEEI
ncbi:MAG: pseudouridine-5'-phosphate glycosidase [Halanaerobiales bacterium]|nr:pseudouridine-5'-phosphate glycosidase [Halanaerobiales bacterium]